MTKWINLNKDTIPKCEGDYLVSDGRNIDVARFFEDTTTFSVSDYSPIDGHGTITHYAIIELPSDKMLDDLNVESPIVIRNSTKMKRVKENIEMAIHEIELLQKEINPSENSNIDRRFKNVVEILKD